MILYRSQIPPKIFQVAFLTGIALIPIDVVIPVFGVRVALAEVFLSFAFILFLVEWDWNSFEELPRSVFVPLAVFVLVCVVSIAVGTDKFLAMRETVQFLWLLIMFAFVVALFSRTQPVIPVWRIVVWTAVVSSVFGIYQYFVYRQPLFELVADTRFRATGFYDQPNTLASFLAPSLLILIGLYLMNGSSALGLHPRRERISPERSIYLVAMAICTAGLTATFSRSNWIAFVLGIIVLGFLSRRYLQMLLLPVAACMIGAASIAVDYSFQPKDKLAAANRAVGDTVGGRSFSDRQRMLLLSSALHMVRDYPLLGVGVGNFSVRLAEYTPVKDVALLHRDYDAVRQKFFINPAKKPDIEIVHNFLLQIASETGLIGFLPFSAFLVCFFVESSKRLKASQSEPERLIRITAISAAIAMLVAALFGWPFSHGTQELLMVVMAISIARINAG